jgi:hypothetical protein
MGLLIDIRSGNRGRSGAAILFWVVVGAVLGATVAAYVASAENAAVIGGIIGAMPGLGIGFYAALGASAFARALAVPGELLR